MSFCSRVQLVAGIIQLEALAFLTFFSQREVKTEKKCFQNKSAMSKNISKVFILVASSLNNRFKIGSSILCMHFHYGKQTLNTALLPIYPMATHP